MVLPTVLRDPARNSGQADGRHRARRLHCESGVSALARHFEGARSARYRPLFRQFFWLFVIVCVGLGWLGSKPPEGIYVILARVFTIYSFAFFLIILPLLGIFEKTKPLPNSISESVLGAKA